MICWLIEGLGICNKLRLIKRWTNMIKKRCYKLIDLRIEYNYFTNLLFFQNSHINSYSDGPFVHWVDSRITDTTLRRLFLSIHLVSLSVPYIGGLCCLGFLLLQHSWPCCHTIAVLFQYTHDLYHLICEFLLHS